MRPRRTSLATGSMAYALAGSGPPVVLLHGYGGARSVWRPVFQDLVRDHTVLALDLPGSGTSPPPPAREGSADFLAIADRISQALEETGRTGHLIVGHSMGAAIAALCALRRPGLFRGLVVVDQSLRPGSPLTTRQLEMAARNPVRFHRLFLAHQAVSPKHGRRAARLALALDARTRILYLRHLGCDDLAGEQKRLRMPVAAFTQSAPAPESPAFQAWIQDQGLFGIGRLEVERFPGAGHWIMLDAPSRFCERLRRFETRLDASHPRLPGAFAMRSSTDASGP